MASHASSTVGRARPTPGKSPWRWMVFASRVIFAFVALGSFKAFGVFIPHFVEAYSTTTAAAGCVSSLSIGLSIVGGPLGGALLSVLTARQLAVGGGAVAGLAMICASTSATVVHLGIWFSLSSIGQSFSQLASAKILIDYFPDEFATANGVSLAGGTIGMMVLPLVTEWFISLYEWRSALALLGALNCHYVVSGALMRPIKTDDYSVVSDGVTPAENHRGARQESPLRRVVQVLSRRFDTEVLMDGVFVVYQTVVMLCGMIFAIWHLYVIPQAIELGYGDAKSALLATYGGVGSLVGRLVHGVPVDRGYLKADSVLVMATTVFALSSFANPLAVSSYAALALLATLSGAAVGVLYSITFVLLRDITGDQHMSAFGWLLLSLGAGQILGGMTAGWMHDLSGNYEAVFLMMGGVAAVAIAVLITARALRHWCQTND